MTRVAFRTFGCKQNQFDTEALRFRCQHQGWQLAPDLEEADWLVVNTCAVTEKAVAKARGEINRWRRLKPDLKILARGCAVQYQPRHFTAADCLNALPEGWSGDQSPVFGFELHPPHGFIPLGKTRGYLRIQSGCDQACAYCIVPNLRGSSQSVPLSECVSALQNLVQAGAPEIVLTGTNIALWGRDLAGKPGLLDLLKALLAGVEKARIRLSSLEPAFISPDFLEWCLPQPNLCRHFHFAVQSGSPEILHRMNRMEFSPELYKCLSALIRRHPDVCLGADVITGLPGETDRNHRETVQIVQSLSLSYLHVFPFSARPGTRASQLAAQVPIAQRLTRAQSLRDLNRDMKKTFIQRNLGHVQDVIRIKTGAEGLWEGLTSNYLRMTKIQPITPPQSRFHLPLESEHQAVLALSA